MVVVVAVRKDDLDGRSLFFRNNTKYETFFAVMKTKVEKALHGELPALFHGMLISVSSCMTLGCRET